MPKEWYDYKENIKNGIKNEFNLRILADKKPYFFAYIYPHLMKQYKQYISNTNKNSYKRFDVSVEELIHKKEKTEEEETFLKYYHYKMPLSMANSVMNKICWRIEDELDGIKIELNKEKFDHTILTTNASYSKGRYDAIKKLYKEYLSKVNEHMKSAKTKKIDNEDRQAKRREFVEEFKRDASSLSSNSEELANIVVNLCYSNGSDNTKQFAWDVSGEQIILNLLKRNNNYISYPIQTLDGEIEYGGNKFNLFSRSLEECDIENCFE
jgi:hypothetical protein